MVSDSLQVVPILERVQIRRSNTMNQSHLVLLEKERNSSSPFSRLAAGLRAFDTSVSPVMRNPLASAWRHQVSKASCSCGAFTVCDRRALWQGDTSA